MPCPAVRRAGGFRGRMLFQRCSTVGASRSPWLAPALTRQHTRAVSSTTTTAIAPVDIIAKKREGEELSAAEIHSFVQRFTAGEVADYQMSAWLMAVCLRGMTASETAELTLAMVQSGSVADLSDIPGAKSDKHSTGGVGDKISLVLAPLVASFGVVVPMMSGRGLGHTGGTLDKLESITGFAVELSMGAFKDQLRSTGVAMVAPSADFAPADRRMYALRDVTATVRAIPLQTASIMCKKLAENPDNLVLDVKFGSGAFNQDVDEAIGLAQSMLAAGEAAGKQTTAFVTSMNEPIGRTVGNWLEVIECIDTLNGNGPADLEELVVVQSAQMLVQSGVVDSRAEGIVMCKQALRDGTAMAKFREMVEVQGGDINMIDTHTDPSWHPAACVMPVLAAEAGIVKSIDALGIGKVGVMLGAGRQRIEDGVDFAAGVKIGAKVGEAVEAGDPLCWIYTNTDDSNLVGLAIERAAAAFELSSSPQDASRLIKYFVDKGGVYPYEYDD